MAATIDGTTGLTSPAGGVVNPSTTVSGINYSCRAWVSFNGSGTVAIRGSGNVSSITDNGTGDYTVNFTTAMTDANYAAGYGPLGYDTGGGTPTNYTALTLKQGAFATFNTTTACRFYTCYTAQGSGGPSDFDIVTVSFFR